MKTNFIIVLVLIVIAIPAKVFGQSPLFAPAVNYDIGYGPSAVIAADLNEDGFKDLAITNNNQYYVTILINNGAGLFLIAGNYGVGANPLSIACADLDGDNDNDLAIANDISCYASVLINNGDATFQPAANYLLDGRSYSIALNDLDGDDDKDMAIAVFQTNRIAVLINNGDGTFQSAVYLSGGNSPRSVELTNVDNDNDIIAANPGTDDISIFKNYGNGTFEPAYYYFVGEAPVSISAAHLNSDDLIDLAVAKDNADSVCILMNDGAGVFQLAGSYGISPSPHSICTEDFDLDGDFDIATSSLDTDSISVLLNNGDGTYQPKINLAVSGESYSIYAADLNNDDRPDLMTANFASGDVSILMSQYVGPVWYVSVEGSDETGDGSEESPFATIQHGIDMAANGDTVLVAEGHYYERINFTGKAITVASYFMADEDSLYIQNTVIDADTLVIGYADTGSVVCFVNDEDSTSILNGFTLQNGIGTPAGENGGGVCCYNSSPIISNCIIKNNTAQVGGGIYAYSKSPILIGCFILENAATNNGGAIIAWTNDYLNLDFCHISNNSSPDAAIYVYGGHFRNCRIEDNTGSIFNWEAGNYRCLSIDSSIIKGSEITGLFPSKLETNNGSLLDECIGVRLTNDILIESNIRVMAETHTTIENCVLIDSDIYIHYTYVFIYSSLIKGEVYIPASPSLLNIYNSTLIGSIHLLNTNDYIALGNCIAAPNNVPVFKCQEGGGSATDITLDCCDFYGFEGDNWLECQVRRLDTTSVFFSDPLFCDTANGDYHISSFSPCAPLNNSCNELIGRHDIGCSGIYDFSLISPANDSILLFTPDSFIWESTEDADLGSACEYIISIDEDSMFSSPIMSDTLLDTAFVYTDSLSRSIFYYWRVQAFNDYAPSIFSNETWNFYIDGYPTSPIIINPEDDMHVDTLTYLTWLASSDPDTFDAVSYTIQIDEDSLFGSPEINQSGLSTGTVLDESFSIRLGELEGFENLSADTKYYWRVRADDNYGLSSPWTDSLHWFNYLPQNHPPNPPTSGFSPADYEEVISLTPTITWNNAGDPDPDDNPGTLHYIFRLFSDTSTGCGFEYWDTTESGINQVTVADTMSDNCLWIYFVKTVDAGGLESDWSAMQHFWTNHYNYPPEPFPLYAPTPDLRWVDYYTYFNWGGTVDYDPLSSFNFTLQLSPDSLFRYFVMTVDRQTDTSLTIITDTLALAGGNLYWRILAVDDDSLIQVGGLPEPEVRKLTIIKPGDANGDGNVIGSDVTYLVNYFRGLNSIPNPPMAGDANGDCRLIGSDVTYLVQYFRGLQQAPIRGNCEQPVILSNGKN